MGAKAVNIHLDPSWSPRTGRPAWSLQLWPLESDGNQETEAPGDIQSKQLMQLSLQANILKVD